MSPQTREEVFKVVRKHQGRFLSALIKSDQCLKDYPEKPLMLEYTVGGTTFAPAWTAGIGVFEDLPSAQRFAARHGIFRPAILVGKAVLFTGEDVRRHQARIGFAHAPKIIPQLGLGLPEGALLAESFTPTKVLPKEDLPVPYRLVEEEAKP